MKVQKNRGFTLVELIAIIVVLAAIFSVAIPIIVNSAKRAENQKYNLMVDVLCDAGKSYFYTEDNDLDLSSAGNKGAVLIYDLIESGLIESNIKNPKTGELVNDDRLILEKKNDSTISCEYQTLQSIPIPTTANSCNADMRYTGSSINLLKNPNSNVIYSVTEGTNVGSYQINASIQPYSPVIWADNTATDKTFTCYIQKANDVLTVLPVTHEYSGDPISATVSTSSGVTPTISYYSDSSCTVSATPINLGDYYVLATTADSSNYNGGETECVKGVTITRRTLVANVECETPKIYSDNNTVSCDVMPTNIVSNDSITTTVPACTFDNENVVTNKTITCNPSISGPDANKYTIGQVTTTGDLVNALITFNPNGGILDGGNVIYVRKGDSNIYNGLASSTIGEVPGVFLTGYTLTGWYSSNTKVINANKTLVPSVNNWTDSNGRWLLTSNALLTANWTPTNYTITYNLDGGSVSPSNPASYTIEDSTITLNNPSKVGHTFTGWTGANGSTPETTVTIATGSTGNKTYTANYSIHFNALTIDPDGGTYTIRGVERSDLTTIFTAYNETITITNLSKPSTTATGSTITVSYNNHTENANPASDSVSPTITTSYEFDGWTTSGTCGTFSNNTYTFPPTDGTVCEYTANWDSTDTINGAVTLPSPGTNPGYRFDGWYTEETGGTRVGGTGDSYTPSSSITLHAHWTELTLTMNSPIPTGTAAVGTGSTLTSGFLVGATVTFTCSGEEGNYPTALQIYGESAVTNTSNASSISATYTINNPSTSFSISATCTGSYGDTITATSISKPIYRRFQLLYEKNGASSLGSTSSSVQILAANSTSGDGGSSFTLPSITCANRGVSCDSLGYDPTNSKTCPRFGTGAHVNMCITGTADCTTTSEKQNVKPSSCTPETTGMVAMGADYSARSLYAVSYSSLRNPTKQANGVTMSGTTLYAVDSNYLYIYNTLSSGNATITNRCRSGGSSSRRYLSYKSSSSSSSATVICTSSQSTCSKSITSSYFKSSTAVFGCSGSNGSSFTAY